MGRQIRLATWTFMALGCSCLSPLPDFVADSAYYNFEDGTQGWEASGATSVTSSGGQAFAGGQSLRVAVSGTPEERVYIAVEKPPVHASDRITAHLWLPSTDWLSAVQVYVQEPTRWTADARDAASLSPGWTTFEVQVRADTTQVDTIGVELDFESAWSGVVYIDSISWSSGPGSDAGT